MQRFMKVIFISMFIMHLSCLGKVFADEIAPRVSISGFGTFGFVTTDSDRLAFTRDRTQTQGASASGGITNDSRLGLQLDVDLTNAIHLTTQFVARDHAGDFLEQNLEWAFLRWTPQQDLDLRFGRMGADLFALSDYRNVGYAYTWVRPPHEFYANVPMYHYDGLDITKKFHLGEDLLSIKVAGAYTYNEVPLEDNLRVNLGAPATGVNMVYESGNWRARFSYSFLHLVTDYTSPAIEQLRDPLANIIFPDVQKFIPYYSPKNTDINFFSLGAAFDDGTWLMQAETSYTHSKYKLFADTASGYLSLGRRFDKLTLYALYGIAYSFDQHANVPKPIVDLPELDALYQTIDRSLNSNGVHEQSISIGLRWDVLPKVALKTEWSHYWFGNNGTRLWLRDTSGDWPEQINLWSLSMDFIF